MPDPSAKWEYEVITVHARHNDGLQAALMEKGEQGWELVFMYVPVANEYQCVLKRPA